MVLVQKAISRIPRAYRSDVGERVGTLLEKLDPRLTYHNRRHMEYVTVTAGVLATIEKVTSHERNEILLAAIFQNTGYVRQYIDAEKESATLFEEYAERSPLPYAQQEVESITNMIRAISLQVTPCTIGEKILRDASRFPIGHKNYFEFAEQYRTEVQTFGKEPEATHAIQEHAWHTFQLEMLENHMWYTDAGFWCYSAMQQKHIVETRKLIERTKT